MPTLLKLWLLLAAAYLAGRVGTSYLAAGYLALSSQFWVEALLVPLLQTLVLTSLREIMGTPALARRMVEPLRRRPVLGLFLLLDTAVLAGLFWLEDSSRIPALSVYFGLRCLSLAVLAALTIPRLPDRNARLIFGTAALSFSGFGLKPFSGGWVALGLEVLACGLLLVAVAGASRLWFHGYSRQFLWPACLILLWLPLGLMKGLSWCTPELAVYPWLWSSVALVLGILLVNVVAMTLTEISSDYDRNQPLKQPGDPGPRQVLNDNSVQCLTKIWLILFVVDLLGSTAIEILGFRLADLRFEAYAQHLVVPWIQALSLIPLLKTSRPVSTTRAVRDLVRRQPFLALFFLADALFLFVSWRRGLAYPSAVPQAWRMADLYNGAKAALAGGLLLSLALRGSVESRWSAIWMSIAGFGAVAYGTTYFVNWLALLPDRLFAGWPLLYRWEFVYAPLFLACLVVLWKMQRFCQPVSAIGASMLELVTVFALVSALIVVLGLFNRPQLTPFWDQIVRSGGFLALATFWAAACRLAEDIPKHRAAGANDSA